MFSLGMWIIRPVVFHLPNKVLAVLVLALTTYPHKKPQISNLRSPAPQVYQPSDTVRAENIATYEGEPDKQLPFIVLCRSRAVETRNSWSD